MAHPRTSATRTRSLEATLTRIVAGLNYKKDVSLEVREPREPAYPAEELYGVIPADARKPPLPRRAWESPSF